jgi:hypothetical protein
VRQDWEPEDLIEVWRLLEDDMAKLRNKLGHRWKPRPDGSRLNRGGDSQANKSCTPSFWSA